MEVDETRLHLLARLWEVNHLYRNYSRERLEFEGGERRAKLLGTMERLSASKYGKIGSSGLRRS